ncbi:phosphatidylinositol N-acetylglucosaminyltransferase [Salix suchowensis]|nr:phosphatidylinositol N-acetylglucosaminyltransferase [Salix suchowensis]
MTDFSMVNRRYGYLHECKWPLEAIDMHHVVVRKSNAKGFFVYLSALIDKSIIILLWGFLMSVLLVKVMFWNRVMKESVVVMPTFGVQLETHYASGRIVHRFIPIGKILKPVLLECVSPVTCYWSLSLLLHGEAELTLVLKELRPPVKMLIPIWKALCDASDIKEFSDTWKDAN